MVKHILIATKNAGKAREFKKLFSEKGIEVKTLLDMENTPEIDENGKTFTENALIKAQTLTDLYKVPVLADDSGIVVDYLNGEPGIYSARYAGDHDDEANKKKLLHNLEGVPFGFGYDPLFFYPPFDKTFGETTADEKNAVSHRANAIKDLLTKFDEWWEE